MVDDDEVFPPGTRCTCKVWRPGSSEARIQYRTSEVGEGLGLGLGSAIVARSDYSTLSVTLLVRVASLCQQEWQGLARPSKPSLATLDVLDNEFSLL